MKELLVSFNTASGRYCCNISILDLNAWKISPRFNTASGRYCCNKEEHSKCRRVFFSFNTASGRYCCNVELLNKEVESMGVSIPQAVGTVATYLMQRYHGRKQSVSIPQAVGTVATERSSKLGRLVSGFNTASGRYCCNIFFFNFCIRHFFRFNTASGRYCCNRLRTSSAYTPPFNWFQYRKR